MLINLKKFSDKEVFDKNFFLYFEEFDLCKSIIDKDENVYKLESFNLNGGRVYCFTDGFSECMNEKKQEIGISGVKELIAKHQNYSLKKELEDATEEIRLRSLKKGTSEKGIRENNDILDDDLTIIGIGK